MPKKGYTVVCDVHGKHCVLAPCQKSWFGKTAHAKLVDKIRGDKSDYIGGAVTGNGSIKYNSTTLNQSKYGQRTVKGKAKKNMRKSIMSGQCIVYTS